MIEQIIKEIKDYYNDGRFVKFDTSLPVNEKCKSFKVEEKIHDGYINIVYLRLVDEHPDVIEVRHIGVRQIKKELEMTDD